MSFGEYIRSLRTGKGFSQVEVAEMANVTTPYLSKIEKDRVPPPSEDVLIRLALALSEDTHRMIVRAGKIPSDFQDVILQDEEAFKYLKKKCRAKITANGG
ncbi:helix-turn-helix domain-containing protein [Paenibacillus prosopidis]|uniref:Helix-turn-helix protein n=1 Tax=Paenibacillus prosopidis TaxID=630520 RepID=A0A368VLU4_9BACL|nr:helix-turn-helix transcriptional regulator [Paenibacillus prosopidis]RCW41666.1 helix-turn-helix protein [Paenibacillus prosopidis]